MRDYSSELKQLNSDIEQITKDLPLIDEQKHELEVEAGMPGFWDDLVFATNETQKLNVLKVKSEAFWQLRHDLEDAKVMRDWVLNDIIDEDEVNEFFDTLARQIVIWKETLLLDGKYDKENAIITLHAGSGGTESCDFTDMMLRAIVRWAEAQNFRVKLTDLEQDKVAGVASATLVVEGDNAYGYAKALNGVFRLVRVSPFDAAGRRHTSFMAVEVIPDLENDDTIEIRDEDIDIETMRAHVHAGGQNVNKVNSAVRITHKPSGIVIRYDAERSQLQNRNAAMAMLKARLAAIKQKEYEDELNGIKGEKLDNGWGNAICSIVLMPYQLVKDNRTNWESSNTGSFLNGDFNDFIRKYLEWIHK